MTASLREKKRVWNLFHHQDFDLSKMYSSRFIQLYFLPLSIRLNATCTFNSDWDFFLWADKLCVCRPDNDLHAWRAVTH